MSPDSGPGEDAPSPAEFTTTQWSVVLNAGRGDAPGAAEALEKLCRAYWYPLYVFVRRQGYSPTDAEDLTQGFFARLIERRDLEAVRSEKGRFRGYLLVSLKHFLTNEWRRDQAVKRGGGRALVSMDKADAEERYRLEPSHSDTPESAYDRRWALAVLERVAARLRAEYVAAGKPAVYDQLQPLLAGEPAEFSYDEIARKLGTTEGTVKQWAHRLRRRYRELVREEIAQTVASPGDIESELRHLVDLLR